ncbi:2-iminoacetate synthase ThiH [Propionivibrio dicarboxylicus]|uniref:Tyrosine lyase ThiH n=1 Tax=Propionivibrio dicarboxylicus TaxID=83767 RepID=A0A1G8GRU2_9RHOO|nr:2-iminoacetate synthase ThiH [Propionivibrio dicarboxylicus]SDH97043.1 tyrosine lyase ThiH [Propionivibrio dicarboxylicus]
MSFRDSIDRYADFDFPGFFERVTDADVERALAAEKLSVTDFLTLLAPPAARRIEAMAQRASQLTVQHFGRTIQMFIPLYLSNHCNNRCAYCGFNVGNDMPRRVLDLDAIEAEAEAIARTGMQHVLILTGEDRRITPPEYIAAAARCLKRHFASVSIEVYPLHEEEYRALRAAGVDGMTVFQETYDPVTYRRVHLGGKKRDYGWRLDAPERAARAGLRLVNIGPLLGLAEPRREIFFTGLHARYLEDHYLQTEVAISLPRINPAEGSFDADHRIGDKSFVQFMTALRMFLPRAGITVSTRERAEFRDAILPLGVTRFSAGSSTGVGGYVDPPDADALQFEITDQRSVAEVAAALVARRFQPVFKDWDGSL